MVNKESKESSSLVNVLKLIRMRDREDIGNSTIKKRKAKVRKVSMF